MADKSMSTEAVTQEKVDKSVERLIGNLIREKLKKHHYTRKKLDDSLSEKAFEEFIKRFDFGHQFFLASDVKKLRKYRFQLDDQMISGEHKLLNETVAIYNKRIDELAAYRKKRFKKDFNFKKDEKLELDPEKRSFFKTKKELQDHWRKVYKQAVLNNYMSSIESQKDLKKEIKE